MFQIKRRNTRKIHVGGRAVGGDAPVSVQSMTCTETSDVDSTVAQIHRLSDAGCEIVRVAVPDAKAGGVLKEIKNQISLPLVADIHFDHRLALQAIEQGVDKIRINPGNIGSKDKAVKVLDAAKEKGIPIRIGVNAGSLEDRMIKKHGGVTAQGLVESALEHVRLCEDTGFDLIVISIKAFHVPMMIEANRILSSSADYPVHLGVTEAGTFRTGSIRSAVGIGTLLVEGIGDTIRVSLTADPVEEVHAGFEILKSLHLRRHGLTFISCPTCGRLQTPLVPIVEALEKALAGVQKSLTVAVMGCAVNGPGEAKDADIGVACGKRSALLFKNGNIVGKLKEGEIVDRLVKEVMEWEEDWRDGRRKV